MVDARDNSPTPAVGTGHGKAVMLGAPGSGKGTQAELLAARLGIPTISTGEMLRSAVAAGSELGARVEGIMASGELVSDELIAEVVDARLAEPDAQKGFLLDGYPRTAPQADALDQILSKRGTRLDHVIYLEVPEEELMGRALARQRADDQEDVVRERLRVYQEKTAPLIDRYRDAGLLRHIDGNRPIETIIQDLADLFVSE